MARSSFCMTSILLLSMVILASAYDYGYDQKPEVDYEKPKSEKKEKLPINKPEDKQKYLPIIPDHKNYEQPKPEHKEKLPINHPEYKLPKQDQEKETVPTKPVYEEPKYSQEKEKFVPTKPDHEVPSTINVQGLVYCKSGLKYFPLQGAVAKVICLAVDEISHKTTEISVLSKPCDSKGSFYATISSPQSLKIKDCKAYLNYSPLKSCNVPTNANNGVSGDLFASFYKIMSHQKDKKLYSAGPFYYTSDEKSTDYSPVPKPDGY